MKSLKICGVLCVMILTFTLTACDGFLHVEGTVYEWINAPNDAKGQIYIDEAIPDSLTLEPVTDITVWFGFRGMPADESGKMFHPPPVTNASGNFSGGWVVAPGNSTYTVSVDEEGYYSLVKDFAHNGGVGSKARLINIVLVRKSN
jgi:hypothetical protein